MKQFLRSLCTLLLLMMWGSVGLAQDKVSVSTLDKSAAKTKTTGDCNAIWSYKDAEAQQTKGTQFLKFNGDLNVSLSEKNAIITKIVINAAQSGTIGKDNKTINIKVGGKSFGEKATLSTKDSKDYSFEGESSGNIVITLGSSTNNASIYIKTVSFTYHLASSKTPTTLTFPKPTINIEEGNEATFTGQTAILKTGETELGNAITYTTNNDAMFEAYDAKVGPKTLKAGEYGTAIVTAKFNGDDTYEASTATYTVKYTEKPKIPTTLDFGFTTKTANINEPFTTTPTLKANDADLAGDITYKSSNTTCATVDVNTGVVTPLTVGQTTITAKYAGTKEYSSSVASYILNVIDPSDTRIIFDQHNVEHPAFENLGGSYSDNSGTVNFVDIHGNNYAFTINSGACKQNSCQIGKGETISSPIFNLTNGYTVRVYYTTSATSNTLLLSVAEDKVYGVKYDNESWVATLSTTKDEAFSLTANSSRVCKVTKIEITPAVVLDENATKEETSKFLEKNINKTIDIVTLTRTLVANKWNTFCVPFETEIAGTALEGATVKTIGTIEGNVINLKDADKIEAGVPYLVKPTTESIVNPTFKSVTISVTTPIEKGNDEYKFVGTYSPKTIFDKDFGKIWGVTADGKLAKINANTTMKGLRAYFVFPVNAAAKLNFDGETTGINNIETNAAVNGKVYNLNGQYVGNSLNGLKKGIYVVNGKKVIK